ncbi:cytochrome P450 [Stereum hirsutum FP-91666 SS1]|uniref:cytochrome P450 n=1 Tax=Stereum hirsutum (strain FP-91666) TaxID=721885 RepID=UPI0004449AC7|nr:cytochrome P450 [Stereum hirsutum FP-91666 SS1]EIM80937.1 cytochrome P450 [Stereum hirsutum FP-91666 SS1]
MLRIILKRNTDNSGAHHYPPGPPAIPVLGNIMTIPNTGPWKLFSKLHRDYGEPIFFWGLGNSILVLSTMTSITDLLDKRGENYSHRPVLTVLGELMGLDRSMPMLPYGREWREQRKLAHVALNPSAVRKYHIVQENLASVLALGILTNPEGFFDNVRLYAERIIFSVVYGVYIDGSNNEYVTQAEETMKIVGDAMVPGAFICDLLPWMKHLPSWLPFRKQAHYGRSMIEALVTKPFEHVQREMMTNIAAPSLTRELLTLQRNDFASFESSVKWATGSLYGGRHNIWTYATILTFMMAMAMNPETQRKAQKEVDEVIGIHRLPVVSDKTQLKYVAAVINETMRWHPVLPLGIARRTDHDDVYMGYFIPKNTVVFPNAWSAQRLFPISIREQFIPERFIDPSEATDDPSTYLFGFGRRVCPGKSLAENSVFIAIATILSALDISEDPDSRITPAFTEALVRYDSPRELYK